MSEMPRKQFKLNKSLEEQLVEESEKTGTSQAEITRRALDFYLRGRQ